jgi:trk system potassium uptake protein TrkH
MHYRVILRILGLLLMIFSTTMLPSVAVSWWYGDGAAAAFLQGFALTLATGLVLWLPVSRHRGELRIRDGFLIVVLVWSVLGSFGALPLMLGQDPHMNLTDAVFESISGLTTTGATVIVGLDQLPQSILYYRQQLQWLGGMGIIVLAVAILPMLGIGGMQLYRAEMPGPVKDSKLTPRIAETAKALWYIYLGLTVLCALAYWAAGMSLFDAIGHSFSTVSTGGFSTHDDSLGHFRSFGVELVAAIFMLLAGTNFALHFTAWRRRTLNGYWRDTEFRAYLFFIMLLALCSAAYLHTTKVTANLIDTLRLAFVQAVSIGSTSGFTVGTDLDWPGFLPVLFIFASFIGGCVASTAGGLKVIRAVLLVKQGLREIRSLIHANAILPLKLAFTVVPERVTEAIWGFFTVYLAMFVLILLLLMALGIDQVTAFAAVAE